MSFVRVQLAAAAGCVGIDAVAAALHELGAAVVWRDGPVLLLELAVPLDLPAVDHAVRSCAGWRVEGLRVVDRGPQLVGRAG